MTKRKVKNKICSLYALHFTLFGFLTAVRQVWIFLKFGLLIGCAQKTPQLSTQLISALVPENQKYHDILAEELKEIIGRGESFLLIDVRTPDEYAIGHIANAINIQCSEVKTKSRTFG